MSGLLVAYYFRLTSQTGNLEGSTLSSMICDRWWHLKLVARQCSQGLGLWSSQRWHV